MANYNGAIVSKFTLAAQKMAKSGSMCSSNIKVGTRPNVKPNIRTGITTQDFMVVEIKRIPKERVLNRFKNLGGNVKY